MSVDSPDSRARAWTGGLLLVAAVLGAGIYLAIPHGSPQQALAAEAIIAASCLLSGGLILRAVGRGRAWPGNTYLALAIFMLGAASLLFLGFQRQTPGTFGAGPFDAAFLLFLIPILGLARAEYRDHFATHDRREIGVDVFLITASFTALLYVMIRPTDANGTVSVASAVFAVLCATQVSAFGALALWRRSIPHLIQFGLFAAMAAATATLGWRWSQGQFDGTEAAIDLPLILCPLAFAALVCLSPARSTIDEDIHEPGRWARPVLTSISVIAACGALAVVAAFDGSRGLDGTQSAVIIGLLGLGVAARILSNQIASTQAHRAMTEALAEKEAALREADDALDRVREANETLRDSEEHLRLVFDTAVDGIVELDERGVVLRANEAFSGMVGLERVAIEGEPWTALAAAVAGADPGFGSLPTGGQAQITRQEGQSLYLESRVSQMPTTPPRKLVLVRDVTAAKVADQTIRSLFQFLQDRDEDRTRLLRRTNAAIESERNRVARDLHDGPVQGVSAASLSLEAALLMIKAGETDRGMEVLTKIRHELTEEADALRRLMSGLRPPVLEERGLIPALRETLSRFGVDHGVETEFAGRLSKSLPEDLETLAYRVVQEALSNAGKHADASSVTVTVDADGSQLRVEIEDDGRGFESNQTREFLRQGRVGLASMRERVELASGTFVVRSSPGRGTSILATLPMDDSPAGRERLLHQAS
jgi:signal transduction histidine kinase